MRPRSLNARRLTISPDYFAMAEIDPDKVAALVDHLQSGGTVPPVVVARYGDKVMPLDGHHRMEAHRRLQRDIDAWVVDGKAFDRLCMYEQRAEDRVMCAGVPAMQVAYRALEGRS